jgi:serine/threonine-protein kinase RsbW
MMGSDPDEPLAFHVDHARGCKAATGIQTPGRPATEQRSIHRRFLSGNGETRAALGDLCGQLAAQGLSEDDLGTIELVLAEALNNITEHAYGPEGGPIEVALDLSACHVRCELRDYGRPMPMGEAPVTELPLISPPDILPEGGFGWHIIRCLVSDLQYERAADHNRLQLCVTIVDPG